MGTALLRRHEMGDYLQRLFLRPDAYAGASGTGQLSMEDRVGGPGEHRTRPEKICVEARLSGLPAWHITPALSPGPGASLAEEFAPAGNGAAGMGPREFCASLPVVA